MADLDTALTRMRAICTDLGDVTEGSHFTARAFSVGGTMFATCGPDGIVFQLEPDHTDALRETNPKFTAYPRLKAATVIQLADAEDWDLLRDLIGESYRIQTAKQNRTKRRAARKQARLNKQPAATKPRQKKPKKKKKPAAQKKKQKARARR